MAPLPGAVWWGEGGGGRVGGIWVFKPLEGDLALEVSQVL